MLFEESPTKYHPDKKYITPPNAFTDIMREGFYSKMEEWGCYSKADTLLLTFSRSERFPL